MSAQTQALGAYGERVAATRLTRAGMVVLDRNWRCDGGEIDLVARDGETLVFVEVKTRFDGASVGPMEAVTPEKAERLRHLAERWLQEHNGIQPEGVRIDVVAVTHAQKGAAIVEHVRGAV